MAATFEYDEDHGALTSGHGATTATAVTEVNWKNIDDSTTAYSASPITAGNNSFTKYQFGKFTGTFNSVSAGLWAHTSGTLGTGLTLKGVVTATYATPAVATNAALTVDMTSAIAIGSGQTVLFGAAPNTAASASISSAGFSQYLATQLQTLNTAAAGDTATVTLTLQYNEN